MKISNCCRCLLSCWLGMLLLFSGGLAFSAKIQAAERLPNIIIFFADDLGYADLGCFGAQEIDTPHIDGIARQGMKLTDFSVSQAVCGASRASLLTGCYANRINMLGAPSHKATHGIHSDETLIPELCRQKGYATAMFGKWHLGHLPPFLPLQHGFDRYLGLPYSNDMWPYHPTNRTFPELPLISESEVINPNVTGDVQKQLTKLYTDHATAFIREQQDKPFFLYVAYAMPHVPLYVSEKFAGTSRQGLYGDVVQEIDGSVGEVLQTLKEQGLEENTLVLFTSDNGPWLSYTNHAGSSGPFREGKGTTFEGGVRVPCVIQWPLRIPAGLVCDELASTIDILPTIAEIIDAPLPVHPIDGHSILPLLTNQPAAKSPHEYYCYYWGNELQAIRSGEWKLHFPHSYRKFTQAVSRDGTPSPYATGQIELSLFNLKKDPGEQHNVATEHPEIVTKLKEYAEQARIELGDSLQKRTGKSIRPAGQLPR